MWLMAQDNNNKCACCSLKELPMLRKLGWVLVEKRKSPCICRTNLQCSSELAVVIPLEQLYHLQHKRSVSWSWWISERDGEDCIVSVYADVGTSSSHTFASVPLAISGFLSSSTAPFVNLKVSILWLQPPCFNHILLGSCVYVCVLQTGYSVHPEGLIARRMNPACEVWVKRYAHSSCWSESKCEMLNVVSNANLPHRIQMFMSTFMHIMQTGGEVLCSFYQTDFFRSNNS